MCATVAQFDSVPIEDFSQFVASWKPFVNEVDERSSMPKSYIYIYIYIYITADSTVSAFWTSSVQS